MYNNIDGYQNEFLFVLEFNNKKIKELNPLLKEIIDDLFPNANENSIIKSWTNHYKRQKADILIKVNSDIKYISIKKGNKNSVHVENLYQFIDFLKELGINNETIKLFKDFHYGLNKNNPKIFLSTHDYCEQNKQIIKNINHALSNIDEIKIIDRFLLSGTNSNNKVNGIIYGTPDDFFWINDKEITEIVKNSIKRESSSVHIGCLFIQPLNRCLNNNPKYMWCKKYIQIKWYSLFDDIIEYKNTKVQKN